MGSCSSKPKDHDYTCKHCQSKQAKSKVFVDSQHDHGQAVDQTFKFGRRPSARVITSKVPEHNISESIDSSDHSIYKGLAIRSVNRDRRPPGPKKVRKHQKKKQRPRTPSISESSDSYESSGSVEDTFESIRHRSRIMSTDSVRSDSPRRKTNRNRRGHHRGDGGKYVESIKIRSKSKSESISRSRSKSKSRSKSRSKSKSNSHVTSLSGHNQPKKQQSESSDSSNHSVDKDLSLLRVRKHQKKKQRPLTPSISESSDSYESAGSVEDEYIDEHQSSGHLIANCLSNDVATINLTPKVVSHRRRHYQPKKKHKIKRNTHNEVKHGLISEVNSPPPDFVHEYSEYFSEEEVIPTSRNIHFTGQLNKNMAKSATGEMDKNTVTCSFCGCKGINFEHRFQHWIKNGHPSDKTKWPVSRRFEVSSNVDRTTHQTQSAYRTSNKSETVSESASVNQSVGNKLRIRCITSVSVSLDQSEDSNSRAVKRHKRGKSTQSKSYKMTKSSYRSTNQTGTVSINQSEDSKFRISKKQTRRTIDGDHIHTLKNMKIEPHLRKDLEYEDSMNKKTISAIKKMNKEIVTCSFCKMKVPFHDRVHHWIAMKHPQEYPASRRFHFLIDEETLKKQKKQRKKRMRSGSWPMESENGQEDKSDDTNELFHGTSNLRKYCRAERKKRYALEDAINAYADGRGPKPNDFAMAVHQLYDLQTVGKPMVMPEHVYEWHHPWEVAEQVYE